MSEDHLQPPTNNHQPPAEGMEHFAADQRPDVALDPLKITPTSQEEVDSLQPTLPEDIAERFVYNAAYTSGLQAWEKKAIKASAQLVEGDLASTKETLESVSTELETQKQKAAELANENADQAAELIKSNDTSIINFQKVAELREERASLEKRAELADKDYLTGILNRLGLDEKYIELVNAASHRRDNHTDTILFIDADSFKQVNDSLGHDGGDEALKLIATSIRMNTREGDIIGRWGGDEFMAILPDIDKKDALLVAEKVRQAVYGLAGIPVQLSVSIGIDTIDRTKKLAKAAKLADKAMKKAKTQGRNQVIMVGSEEA